VRKVNRSDVPIPGILQADIVRKALREIVSHFSDNEEVRLKRRIPINKEIFNFEEVKTALDQLFHRKCAYCETPLIDEFGLIDHFRPLANAANLNNQFDSPDHYGWFAYDWSNFMLSCSACNRAKRNLFPVSGTRAMLLCTWLEADEHEKGTLIDPCSDDPGRHLSFDIEGLCFHTSKRGAVSIEVLDLNRPQLIEFRKAKIDLCLSLLEEIRHNDGGDISRLNEELLPESPYSGVGAIVVRTVAGVVAAEIGMPKPSRVNLVRDSTRLVRDMPADRTLSSYLQRSSQGKQAVRLWEGDDPIEIMQVEPSRYFHGLSKRSAESRIKHIHISNFKGIERLSISFSGGEIYPLETPCLMMLGENATGKSSVLQAISLCLMGEELRTKLQLNPEDYLSREPMGWKLFSERITEVSVEFEGGERAELRIDPLRRRFEGDIEPATVVLAYGARRFFDEKRRVARNVDRVKTLFNPLATVAHPTAWLERIDEHTFNALSRAMREIFVLRPNDEIFKDKDGRVFIRAHGRETPIERLSEGYKSLFAMTVDIARYLIDVWGNLEGARGVVLIDEIETHLHPRWKMRVVAALRAALPQVQFITTTHDPLCLRGMGDGEVQVLFRNNENAIENLIDLPNVKSLRTEQLLTSDYFGLASSSDPDFENSLDEYAAIIGQPVSLMSNVDGERLDQLESELRQNMYSGPRFSDNKLRW